MDSKFSIGNKVAIIYGHSDCEYGVVTSISDIGGKWWYMVIMPSGDAEIVVEDDLRLWDPAQDPPIDMRNVVNILANAGNPPYKTWAEFNGVGASDRTFKNRRIRIHKNEVVAVSDSAVEGIGNACIDTSQSYRFYVKETYEEVCKVLGWE